MYIVHCTCTLYCCSRGSLSEDVLVNELSRPGVVRGREGEAGREPDKLPESPKVKIYMYMYIYRQYKCIVHCVYIYMYMHVPVYTLSCIDVQA